MKGKPLLPAEHPTVGSTLITAQAKHILPDTYNYRGVVHLIRLLKITTYTVCMKKKLFAVAFILPTDYKKNKCLELFAHYIKNWS